MWNAFAPMAIMSAVAALVGYFVNMRQEANRIKNIFNDYKKELESGYTKPVEAEQLETLSRIANDTTRGLSIQKQAYDEIAKRLNLVQKKNETQLEFQNRINQKVKDRIKLLEDEAKASIYAQKAAELSDKYDTAKKELGLNILEDPALDFYMGKMASPNKKTSQEGLKALVGYGMQAGKTVDGDYQDMLKEMNQNWQALKYTRDKLAKVTENTLTTNSSTHVDANTDNDKKEKKTELQKQEEKYAQSIRELNARREVEKMSLSDYNKAMDDLNRQSLIEAKSSKDKQVLNSKHLQILKKAVANPAYNKTQAELEKVQKEYGDSILTLDAKLKANLITEKEYNEALNDAAISAANSAISIDGIGDAANDFIKKMQSGIISRINRPTLEKRDTTFDYKTSDSDKIAGELDVWKKYKSELEDLKDKHKGLSKELQEELDKAIKNIPSLEQSLKLAQVKEDVKNFTKELNEGMYSGIKDIASSSDRVVSAFSQLRDVMNDVDASAWEQIMAIWNAMTQVVDSFMSICKTIETLTELSNKLARAKQTEAAIDKVTTEDKVANAVTGATASVAAASVEKSAAGTEVAANTAKGASAAGASAAKLPFPWNIVAIGGAIAAAIAAFAVIPKFASGGIVTGGPSSGDKILARVNAGEMILNQGQQSRLFQAINSGQLGSGRNITVQVEGVVKGHDLHIVQRNYAKSTGKLNGKNINF